MTFGGKTRNPVHVFDVRPESVSQVDNFVFAVE